MRTTLRSDHDLMTLIKNADGLVHLSSPDHVLLSYKSIKGWGKVSSLQECSGVSIMGKNLLEATYIRLKKRERHCGYCLGFSKSLDNFEWSHLL
jgi:hypothetical protein